MQNVPQPSFRTAFLISNDNMDHTELSRMGGRARAKKLSARKRREIASTALRLRWSGYKKTHMKEITVTRGQVESWMGLQKKVRYGAAGVYIGTNTIMSIAGDRVTICAKPRTSYKLFLAEVSKLK